MKRANPQPVNFKNTKDLEVLVLGSLGFGTDFIVRKTGLTYSQVLYRLRKGEVKRSEYRDGTGFAARIALETAHGEVTTRLGGQRR